MGTYHVQPPPPRYRLRSDGMTLEITIPGPRQIFAALFMLVWLGGWLFGEVMVGGILWKELHPWFLFDPVKPPIERAALGFENLFLLSWFVLWTIGGGFVIYQLLWNVVGQERIWIDNTGLRIRREVLGFGVTRLYDLSAVSNLRVAWSQGPLGGMGRFDDRAKGMTLRQRPRRGMIQFDYGAKTVAFGESLDEAEARLLVADILRRYPRLGTLTVEEEPDDVWHWG